MAMASHRLVENCFPPSSASSSSASPPPKFQPLKDKSTGKTQSLRTSLHPPFQPPDSAHPELRRQPSCSSTSTLTSPGLPGLREEQQEREEEEEEEGCDTVDPSSLSLDALCAGLESYFIDPSLGLACSTTHLPTAYDCYPPLLDAAACGLFETPPASRDGLDTLKPVSFYECGNTGQAVSSFAQLTPTEVYNLGRGFDFGLDGVAHPPITSTANIGPVTEKDKTAFTTTTTTTTTTISAATAVTAAYSDGTPRQQRLASPFADRRKDKGGRATTDPAGKVKANSAKMVLNKLAGKNRHSSEVQNVNCQDRPSIKHQQSRAVVAETALQTPTPFSNDSCRKAQKHIQPSAQQKAQLGTDMSRDGDAQNATSGVAAAAPLDDAGQADIKNNDAQTAATPRQKDYLVNPHTTSTYNANTKLDADVPDSWTRFATPDWDQSLRGTTGLGSFEMSMGMSINMGLELGMGMDDENCLQINTPSRALFQDGIEGMLMERTPNIFGTPGPDIDKSKTAGFKVDRNGPVTDTIMMDTRGRFGGGSGGGTAGLQSSPIRLPKKKLFDDSVGNQNCTSDPCSTATPHRQRKQRDHQASDISKIPSASLTSSPTVSGMDSLAYDDPFKGFLPRMPTSLDQFSDSLRADNIAQGQPFFPDMSDYNYIPNLRFHPPIDPACTHQPMFMTPHASSSSYFGNDGCASDAFLPATSPILLPTTIPHVMRADRPPQHFSFGRHHGFGNGYHHDHLYGNRRFTQSQHTWMMNDDDPAMFLSSPARRIGSGCGYSPTDTGSGDTKGIKKHATTAPAGSPIQRQPYHHQNEEGRREREMREERRKMRYLLKRQQKWEAMRSKGLGGEAERFLRSESEQGRNMTVGRQEWNALESEKGRRRDLSRANTVTGALNTSGSRSTPANHETTELRIGRKGEGSFCSNAPRRRNPMRSTSSILPLNGNNDEENGLRSRSRMSPIKRAVSSVLPGSSAGNHGRNILPAASLERMVLKIGEDGRATTEIRITASLDECEEDDGNETDSQGRHQGAGEESFRGHTMNFNESALHVADHSDDDDDVDAFDDNDDDDYDDDEGNESDLFSDFEADYQHMLNPQSQGLDRRRKDAHGNESFTGDPIDKLISSQVDDEIFAPGAMPDLAINGVRAAAVLTPKSRSKSRTFSRSTSCFVPKATAASRYLTRSSSARAAPNDPRLEQIKLKIEGLAIEKKAEFDNTDLNEDESDDDNEIKTKEDEGKGQAQVELRELLARNRNQPCGPMVRPDRLGYPQPEGSKNTAVDSHASVRQIPSPCVSASSVKGRPSPTGTISSQSTRDSTPTPAPISQSAETIPQKIPPKPTIELATSEHSPTRTVPVARAQTEKSRKITPPTPANLLNTPVRKKHTFVQYTPTPKGKGKGSKALTKQIQQPSPSPRNKTLKAPTVTVSARKPPKAQQTQQQPPLPPSSPPLFPYSQPLGQATSALHFPPILPAPPSGPPPSSPTTVTDPELGTTTPLANSSFESVWSRTAGDHGKNENNAKPREKRRPSNPSNGTRCVCQSNEIGGHLMVKCSVCSFWLHTKCVGLERQKLPANYVCAVCIGISEHSTSAGKQPGRQIPKMAEMKTPRTVSSARNSGRHT